VPVANELRRTLLPAYRCAAFDGICGANLVRYDPAGGLFPRGYAGASGQVDEVELVLVLAEPGEPPEEGATPMPEGEPGAIIDQNATRVGCSFRDGKSVFHRNVRYLLDQCWLELTFEEQMRRTWITEGVLCSAAKASSPVPRIVETECAKRYLAEQLAVLRGAFVIALGGKAKRRVGMVAGRSPNMVAFAAGKPGGLHKAAKSSWSAAAAEFHAWRATHTTGIGSSASGS